MNLESHSQPLYHPKPDEKQLTARSIIVGCLLGSLVTIINVYFGLQTGWTLSGALIAAIIGYAFFQLLPLKRHYTILENVITETAGSAASAAAPAIGTVSVFPALKLMGHPLSITTMYIWAIAVGFLGIFFAVPLRKQMILVEKLRFPTGTVTADTILAMHHAEENANKKAHVLLIWSLLAATYTLAAFFIPVLHHPPLLNYLGLGIISYWGFRLFISPLLIGAGMIIGLRIGLSLLIGAIVSWGILGPYIAHQQWVNQSIFDYRHGVAGWLLWPGVALMIAESLVSFLLFLPMMFKNKINTSETHLPDKSIPTLLWLSGLIICSIVCCITVKIYFDIPVHLSILAIFIAWILSVIAARATGETDINPLTAVGKITQLIYGAAAPGQVITNLMAAGISSAGATSAGDMLQDWKTGYLLNASPKAQLIAQCWGTFAGILFAVPIYKLFDSAYTIGTGDLPAPSAHAWQAMSELLSQGWQSLPLHVGPAVVMAALLGASLPMLRQIKKIAHLIPSGLGLGIAFVIPAYYSIIMFMGALILWSWAKIMPLKADTFGFSVASGLIVGEGLMGVVVAVLILCGVHPLF